MITMNEQQQTRSENSSSTELSARKVGAGSAALVAAMMVVNAINFGVNIWLASVLAPGTFGDISLMVTLLLISGVLASMLQLTTCVATMDPTRDATKDVGAMRLLTNRIGLAGAVALMIAAPQLTTLLNIGNAWALLIMAAGLPVVASSIPVHTRWIVEGENGLTAAPDDAPAFAKHVCRLLTDQPLCDSFVTAGRELANQLTIPRMVQAYETWYEEIIS